MRHPQTWDFDDCVQARIFAQLVSHIQRQINPYNLEYLRPTDQSGGNRQLIHQAGRYMDALQCFIPLNTLNPQNRAFAMYTVVTINLCYIRFHLVIENSDFFAQSGESGPDSFKVKNTRGIYLPRFDIIVQRPDLCKWNILHSSKCETSPL